MKKLQAILISILSLCSFIITLFVSLTLLINNEKFFQKIWEKEGVYEQMNLSEEELTKVINHTMKYMWGEEDSLVIYVTDNNGNQIEFYKDYHTTYNGLEMNEYKHMEECRSLFMGGKTLTIISTVTALTIIVSLYLTRNFLDKESLNIFYYAYGFIFLLLLILGLFCLIDFDKAFIIFHDIFFANSNVSYSYPGDSLMILMLPEKGLFNAIVYKTLIHFFSFLTLQIIAAKLIQKRLGNS